MGKKLFSLKAPSPMRSKEMPSALCCVFFKKSLGSQLFKNGGVTPLFFAATCLFLLIRQVLPLTNSLCFTLRALTRASRLPRRVHSPWRKPKANSRKAWGVCFFRFYCVQGQQSSECGPCWSPGAQTLPATHIQGLNFLSLNGCLPAKIVRATNLKQTTSTRPSSVSCLSLCLLHGQPAQFQTCQPAFPETRFEVTQRSPRETARLGILSCRDCQTRQKARNGHGRAVQRKLLRGKVSVARSHRCYRTQPVGITALHGLAAHPAKVS